MRAFVLGLVCASTWQMMAMPASATEGWQSTPSLPAVRLWSFWPRPSGQRPHDREVSRRHEPRRGGGAPESNFGSRPSGQRPNDRGVSRRHEPRRGGGAPESNPSGALLALAQEVQAPPAPAGPPLSLGAALGEALERNPTLITLRREYDALRHRPAQERFLDAPMLETTIWQWPITTLNPWNTNMYMLMFTQDIPGSGKRGLRAAVAEKDVDLALNTIAAKAREIVGEVKRSYAELFVARKAIDIHLATVDLLRQFADISEAKYRAGRISQHDVLKAVLELSTLHEDIVMLEQQREIAGARLNTLLDRPADAPIGPLVEPHEQVLLPAVAELQRLALEHQPELQAADLEIERAEAELAVAKSEYKPDYSVQGGYLVMPRQTDALLMRLAITWPRAPWARGKLDAEVAEAGARIAAARARRRAMENAIRYAVQEAYVRATTAAHRAALLRTSIVPQSEQTLEVSRAAYQTDRVDFLALLDNQRVLLDKELDYYRALSDLEQALADLERAVGAEMSPTMIAAVPQAQ